MQYGTEYKVGIYDAATLHLLYAIPIDEPQSLLHIAWNATGRYIATGGQGRCIHILDLLTGETKKLFGHSDQINSLHFSPDGQRLLSSGGGRCIIWNPETGERVAEWASSVTDDSKVRESPREAPMAGWLRPRRGTSAARRGAGRHAAVGASIGPAWPAARRVSQ